MKTCWEATSTIDIHIFTKCIKPIWFYFLILSLTDFRLIPKNLQYMYRFKNVSFWLWQLFTSITGKDFNITHKDGILLIKSINIIDRRRKLQLISRNILTLNPEITFFRISIRKISFITHFPPFRPSSWQSEYWSQPRLKLRPFHVTRLLHVSNRRTIACPQGWSD